MNTTPGILARWYAEPLGVDDAQALLQSMIEREQAVLKRQGKPRMTALLKMTAIYWLGDPIEEYYHHLTAKREHSAHMQVLKPLIYGQLLMSRHREGAMAYLDHAFEQARRLLHPADYFTVMKRHQLLGLIPLSHTEGAGENLATLLTTAAVIQRMHGVETSRQPYSHDPNDTYG